MIDDYVPFDWENLLPILNFGMCQLVDIHCYECVFDEEGRGCRAMGGMLTHGRELTELL